MQTVSTSFSLQEKQVTMYGSSENEHIFANIKNSKSFYEEDLLQYLSYLPLPHGHAIDIGANIGNHTVYFSHVMGMNVHSFEILPELRNLLKSNIDINNVNDLVTIYNCGLYSKNTFAELEIQSDNMGKTHIIEVGDDVTSGIELNRLDDILPDTIPVSLVKIDVEGVEQHVLYGAQETIKRCQPICIVECHTSSEHQALRAYFSNLNYLPVSIHGISNNWVFAPIALADELIAYSNVLRQRSIAEGNKLVIKNLKRKDNSTIVTLRKESETLQKESETLQKESETLQKELETLKKESETLQKELENSKSKLQSIEKEVIFHLDKIDFLTHTLSHHVGIAIVENLQFPFVWMRIPLAVVKAAINYRRHKNSILNSSSLLSVKQKKTGKRNKFIANPTTKQSFELSSDNIVMPPSATMERDYANLKAIGHSLVTEKPLVSIIITTFNSVATVRNSLASLLNQSYSNLEIIISDDASSDGTCAIVTEMMKSDPRIKLIKNIQNKGTYFSKNVALLETKGEILTFMDSDDRSAPNRIELQLNAIRSHDVVASQCNYIRESLEGNIILNRGLLERKAPISLMIKKEVIEDIGFFDSVRTSADTEYIGRIELAYGKNAILHVKKPLYFALMREGSLTNDKDNKVNLSANDDDALFLSTSRYQYQESFVAWHASLRSENKIAYMPFPLTDRPFEIPDKLRISSPPGYTSPVIAFMASFPLRMSQMELSVKSILPQVDRLFVYLNEYTEIPSFLDHPKISALPAANMKNLRDNGKLYYVNSVKDAYCFLIDDDIIYPNDYVSKMIHKIEYYNRKSIIGIHGIILEHPFTRYFSEGRKVYNFKHALENDHTVNLLGTGTVAFHSSVININIDEIQTTGMVDVWLGIIARRNNVGMIAISRPDNWLKPIYGEKDEKTLFDEFRYDDSQQTELLKSIDDWKTPEIPNTG